MLIHEMWGKTITVIKAEFGAYGANGRTGKIVKVDGKETDMDVFVQMLDDNSIWNIGNRNKIEFILME